MALTRLNNNSLLQTTAGDNFRNIIINGDMSIAQRGTSFTGLGNGDNATYTLDRFAFNESGAPTGECTFSQNTDVPTGQGFAKSLKVDITTAQTTMAAGDLLYTSTMFEGQNLQYLKYGTSSADKLTLSFWVKSNVTTGNFAISLYNQDPSTTRIVNLTYSINVADTWEKKTFTIDGDTASGNGFDNDNNRSLWVNWIFSSGVDWTSGTQSSSWQDYATTKWGAGHTANLFSSTSNYINITGVQLEAGTTASDFEFLPYDVNMQRCERYYQVLYYIQSSVITTGNSATTSVALAPINYKPLRVAPSVTLPPASKSNGAAFLTSNAGSVTSVGTHTVANISVNNFIINASGYTGLTDDGVSLYYVYGSPQVITLDAEL